MPIRRSSARKNWPARFAGRAKKAPGGPLQSFYATPPPDPDTPLAQVPMIAVDLETTGLDPDRDDIVSIGMVTMDIHRITCRDARHWVFKPERALSDTSVTIHEITHSDVRDSPALESRCEDILAALAGRVVVVHFAPIERRFLARAARRLYGYPLEFPIIDTMELERRHQTAGLRRWFSRAGSLRLDACRARLHLPRYKAHHALTDALATAELLQAQVAHRHKPTDPVKRFWI
jgi:DNA polymerase-3 subunit epsilon